MSCISSLCLMDSAGYIRLLTDRMAQLLRMAECDDFLLLSRVKLNIMFEVLH